MRYVYLKPIQTAEDKKRAKKLPRMSKAELAKLIKDRVETKVISPASAAKGDARRAAHAKATLTELAATLKGRKSVLNDLLKLPEAKRSAAPSRTHKRTGQKFMLQSPQALLQDAYTIKLIRDNRAVAVAAFGTVRAMFDKSTPAVSVAVRRQVDKLSKLQGLDGGAIATRQRDLFRLWRDWQAHLLATDANLTQPGAEEGEGSRNDRTGAGDCAGGVANPKGLITLHRWPLKGHVTSIKNQGNRGTCSAFGTVAAVEAAVSVKYGRKLNLSEQDLYKKQRLDWSPSLFNNYDEDGYSPIFSMLFQLVSGYVFPFEKDWEYNPSQSRVPRGTEGPWTMSCVGYNGLACSDTNHQAERKTYVIRTTEVREVVSEVCDFVEPIPIIGLIGGWFCDRVTDVIEIVEEAEVTVYETNVAGTSRHKATQWLLVWDPIWDNDITAAKVLLTQRVPLIFCFTVPDSWNDDAHTGPNGLGYIVFNQKEAKPKDAGGHCVAIVGHIDNGDIPAAWGLEPGAGGGYFIIKNSWGVCWADRGYVYAPYAWVNQWGTAIVAITQVERI